MRIATLDAHSGGARDLRGPGDENIRSLSPRTALRKRIQ